jgi:hypothetical protein
MVVILVYTSASFHFIHQNVGQKVTGLDDRVQFHAVLKELQANMQYFGTNMNKTFDCVREAVFL